MRSVSRPNLLVLGKRMLPVSQARSGFRLKTCQESKATLCLRQRMEFTMKKLFSRFRTEHVNMNTEFARARMARSMPGETAALISMRYAGMSF